jgi:DNA-directed RNA polymerase subunit H (RpoH/RPB5)
MGKKEVEVEKHVLVPEHKKLNEEEKEELLETYNVNEKELPRIKKDDPAIKKLEVKVGDIIEIKRKVLTTGEDYSYYRIVV